VPSWSTAPPEASAGTGGATPAWARSAAPRAAAAATLAGADDVAPRVGWLHRDVWARAGPCPAERVARYDILGTAPRARAPQGPHRRGPLCRYLAKQRDAVGAFAAPRDADLTALAAAFPVSPAAVRALRDVAALDGGDPRRGPRQAALRQQLRRWC
jgi:hypothetical protein